MIGADVDVHFGHILSAECLGSFCFRQRMRRNNAAPMYASVLQGWGSVIAQRREGRERLQKVAALLVLGKSAVVPMGLTLPQTPTAALALGVLLLWRLHCQVAFCAKHAYCLRNIVRGALRAHKCPAVCFTWAVRLPCCWAAVCNVPQRSEAQRLTVPGTETIKRLAFWASSLQSMCHSGQMCCSSACLRPMCRSSAAVLYKGYSKRAAALQSAALADYCLS